MRYAGERDFNHSRPENIGVLLANLGTPAAPETAAVRKYLREFLSDPRVVEAPRLLWQLVLNLWILPRRAPKTAAAYRKIWQPGGSPLLLISRRQRAALARELSEMPIAVALGMRYGQPSVTAALNVLREQNCRRIVVLPLYPQYAASTVGSVFDAVANELKKWRAVPPLRFIHGYADDNRYIAALAESINRSRENKNTDDGNNNGDKNKKELLLFSFHGMPKEMLLAGDPYYCQCQKTARLTAEHLRLAPEEWRVSFQSRFGKAEWLKPYTEETLRALPKEGCKNVRVVCPAFSADCLETLEEIAQEGRKTFQTAGGETFAYIPALNDDPAHISFLRDLILQETANWQKTTAAENDPGKLQKKQERRNRHP